MAGHGFIWFTCFLLLASMLLEVSQARDVLSNAVGDLKHLELPTKPTKTEAPSVTLTIPYPGHMTGALTTVLPPHAFTTVRPGEGIVVTIGLPGHLTGAMTVTVTEEQPIPTTLYVTHVATVVNQPITVTVAFPYPSVAPGRPKGETFDCKDQIRTGWPDFYTMPHTVNKCYPILWPTCIREAKAAFAKFRDFCGSWNKTMNVVPHKSCLVDHYVPDDGEERYFQDELTMWLKVKTCCYSNDREFDRENEWCKIYRMKDMDEWEYYTQNFGVYGVYDEDFIYNLSEENYDPSTGWREYYGYNGDPWKFPVAPPSAAPTRAWRTSTTSEISTTSKV
ncbi:hypothetical protein B0A52_09793 [Exophiala mesophila]|uniref:Uncharacterized protein n=1 Tax=Exophiala mesophila TaxID=212818 RepID=A0A438MS62_EXOME|nr:hypothetical protein B0A52_09793 [Exophiala mesophila]